MAEWAHAGVFQRLQELLLDEPGEAGGLDWSRSAWTPAGDRGDLTGASPVDRATRGCKLHLAVEGGGLPLSVLVTGATTNDSLVVAALLEDLPKVRTPAGGRRCRPEKGHADKADDHRRCRGSLSRPGSRSASPAAGSSRRSGWGVTLEAERSIGWLAGCRRLRVRYDRDAERFFAFATLACAQLGYNRLPCAADARSL